MYKFTKFETNRSVEEARVIYEQRIADALEIFEKHKDGFNYRACFICGGNDFSSLEKFHNAYDIAKCNICASESVNPTPSEAALTDYYNNGKCNIMLDQVVKSRNKKPNDFITDDRVEDVLDIIAGIDAAEINILEIGCGSGVFLSKLKYFISERFPERNVVLAGIDVDANAIKSSVNKDLKLTVANAESYLKSVSKRYDIVLHFELIEHLADPFEFMTSLHRLLKTDGIMYFSTPNGDGLEMLASGYNDFRPLAHSIFPPMHLNAFSVSNIRHFAIRSGFKVVDVSTPGRLDVDMLSIFENEIDDGLKLLSDLDDDEKGVVQHLVSYLRGSSHMRCVLKKNELL
jgi:2-polyprenyl-6-hydroxyphenyl methylase / 3-demethylubiquinone-9 3-methyltransferase